MATSAKFAEGIRRFVIGLAKKMLIANVVALPADQIFKLSPHELTCALAWLGTLCYTLQIYFDFSGYSDMAVGLGKMFGFEFMENFNYPYISQTLREFWRRWHISLSSWFRDYLYHDSFADSWVPYLGYHFREIIYVPRDDWDYDFMLREKPDVVIDETVERYFNNSNPGGMLQGHLQRVRNSRIQ